MSDFKASDYRIFETSNLCALIFFTRVMRNSYCYEQVCFSYGYAVQSALNSYNYQTKGDEIMLCQFFLFGGPAFVMARWTASYENHPSIDNPISSQL